MHLLMLIIFLFMWPFEDISPYCPSPDEATLVDLVNIADTKSRQNARQKHAFGDMINFT